jgi:hypothetical protein
MKAITNTTRGSRLEDRLKRIDPWAERPPDRELRRLRNLSRDVGTACGVWLASRGIKTRPWGDFNVSRSAFRRIPFDLQADTDS